MRYDRSSGILLHITSLPSEYGIGDLGPSTYQWVDTLTEMGCGLWQVLPLGPTGYGDSPYQCFSAFAGNHYLISPDLLVKEGLLHESDLEIQTNTFSDEKIDYGSVIQYKVNLLNQAYKNLKLSSNKKIIEEFEQFTQNEQHWLREFSIFMALKELHDGISWVEWAPEYRDRTKEAISKFVEDNYQLIEQHAFYQFLFFSQWKSLKEYANQNGVKIIGDIPIFIAHDSSDTWANRRLFYLDDDGNPTVVAGVPPDYFSDTGQLWGNPLYRWNIHAQNNYKWWIQRINTVLQLVDYVRIDHFRGFAGYWEVPASESTAINGKWVPGPGENLFRNIQNQLGDPPILAEDLGVITEDVEILRDTFNFPGMNILQFGFDGDPTNKFLPHNYKHNSVVYTGTHDNDTAIGWFNRAEDNEKDFLQRYLNIEGNDISWDLIRAAWASTSMFAIAPMQDLLSLDNTSRMNYPSKPDGNWTWRMRTTDITEEIIQRMWYLNNLFDRKMETD